MLVSRQRVWKLLEMKPHSILKEAEYLTLVKYLKLLALACNAVKIYQSRKHAKQTY